MKKNFISLLFVSAITVGLLSACSSAPADDNATNPKAETVTSQANHDTNSSPVSVTLNEVAHSIFYAPQYVAVENGYFADEGINLTLVTGFGADKVMTAVLSGEAETVFFIHTFYLSAHTYLILPAVFKIFTFFCLCHIR